MWSLALLTVLAAPAQQIFPLETLKIVGNRRLAAEKIIAVSGLTIGAPVVKADFDRARQRLLSTGAFETVAYEFKPGAAKTGYDAVIDVAEVDQVFPYRFEDLPVSEDALRAALRAQEPILGDQIPATKEVIERYLRAIQQQVGSKLKITGTLNSDLPGQLMIVFRPDARRDQVAEVKFANNDVLPAALLVRTLAEVAIGTTFSETTLRVLLDSSIRPLYEARGRIRVAFSKIEARPSMLVDGVVVTVIVNEGPSYSLGEVKFSGVDPGDLPELQKIANVQAKDIVNFDQLKAGLDRILARYRNKGYLHVTGRLERDIDDQGHQVNVTEAIDPGPQFTMGALEIAGLDLTSEPEIRKVWELKPGSPFRPDYPDAFLNDIRAQGVFDNLGKTRAETNINEKTHVVDVKLYFAGAATEDDKQRRRKKSW